MSNEKESLYNLKREQINVINKLRTITCNLVSIAKQFNKYIFSEYETFKLNTFLTNYCKWIGLRISSKNYRDYIRLGLLNNGNPIVVVIDRKYKSANVKHHLYFINIINDKLPLIFDTDKDIRIIRVPHLYSNERCYTEKTYNIIENSNSNCIKIKMCNINFSMSDKYKDLFNFLVKLRNLIALKERYSSKIIYEILGVPKWFVNRIFIFDKRNYRKLLVKIIKDKKLQNEIRYAWYDYINKRRKINDNNKLMID